jgi:hypothetical protein
MKLLIILAISVVVAVVARAADAEPAKAPKPSVCLSYQVGEAKGQAFAICYDSEKPALFSRFAEVVVPGKDGGSVKVLVGWR